MRLKFYSTAALLLAGLMISNNTDAQWTRNAATLQTYLTNTGDNVGIGTTNPTFKLDVRSTGIATMNFKSTTDNASFLLDRGASNKTSSVTYRTGGVNDWQTGCVNNYNFTIRNNSLGAVAIYCDYANNYVGVGTTVPNAPLSLVSNSLGGINTTGSFQIGQSNTTNLVLDNNEVQARYNGGAGTLFLQYWAGDINACQAGGSASFYGPVYTGSTLNVAGNASLASDLYVNGNVGIGTASPLYKLDILGSTSCFGQIKGSTSWAGLVIDKGAITDNCYTIYRTGGGDRWTTGTIGNDNYCIRNWPLGTNALTVNASNNFVGIGTASPGYLLDVQGDAAGSSYYNVYSYVNYAGTSDIRAFYGYSHPADGWGYGVNATGGYYGGYITCSSGAYGFGVGVYGGSSGSSGTHYGIYGSASGGTTNWGVYSAGYTYSTSGYSSSDAKLKKDVRPIENALEKINQLQPRTYTFKTEEYKYMGLPTEQQYGFIAQELERVLPDLVKDVQQPIDNDFKKNGMLNFKAVNYTEMIPLLTQAMQEQQKQIEAKDARIAALESKMDQFEKALSQCCSASSASEKQSSNSATDAARLEQNQPNPFTQNSTIKFYVPSNFRSAQLVITDMSGIQLKSINIAQSGVGQVTINGFELTSGNYLYSLYIDNVKVDTKKMELTK